ncbi:MAG: hypothetical protein ABI729_10055 [Chitinophagales bacterium]
MQEIGSAGLFSHLFTKPIYTLAEPVSIKFKNLEHKSVESPQLLFLFKNAFNQEIPESDFELLRKMAAWLGVAGDNTACHLCNGKNLSFRELTVTQGIENIIGCGITPADITLNIDYEINRAIRFMNCKLLFTVSFAEVQKNEMLKKEFFNEAGKLFNHLKGK